ncbi:hypothetical protein LEP1GSC163_2842 [Leptospira santarosai str. CBC379]|nr:hypothetical protein LEP1GSC163_2842 [Leptospira santarosai str. CBC379]
MRSAVKAGNRREKKNRKSEFLDSKGGIRFRKIRNGQDLFEELLSFSKILFEKGNQQIPCRI